jgi:hypothetical protein
MNEELRNRYRRDYTSEPIKHRQATPKPLAPPANPAIPSSLAVPSLEERAIPKHQPKRNSRRQSSKTLITVIVLLLIVAGAGAAGYYKFYKKQTPTASAYFPSSIASQVSIALYYPINLPAGYKVNNDYKILQQNVVYYSIKDPAANRYAVTIQPLPANFDFNQFKGKFLKPDEFSTSIGSALVGTAGANLIASIRTNDNDWIIINATNTTTQSQLETIVRSLHKSK